MIRFWMGKKEVITSIVPSIAGPLKKSSPAGYVPVVSLADSDDLAACHHVIIFAIAFKITSLLAPPQHSGIGPFRKPPNAACSWHRPRDHVLPTDPRDNGWTKNLPLNIKASDLCHRN